MKSDRHILCIDLGGTKIEIGRFATDGTLAWRKKIPTYAERGGAQAMDRIAAEVAAMHRSHGEPIPLDGVALCTPGPIDNTTGIVYHACNLPTWGAYPIAAEIERRLQLPTVVEHDAKAAALGEYYFGLREREKNFVYIIIGTGVGGAIIHNGALFRGLTNCSGEIGFTSINYDATHNHPGDIVGNVESYLGGPDIAEYYRAHADNAATDVDVRIVAQRAAAGEEAARLTLEHAGRALGILICNLATTLDYTLFVIGGSVSKLGAQLIDPAYRAVQHYSHAYFRDNINIQPASVLEDAALLGCYYLMRTQLQQGAKQIRRWS